MTGITYSLDDGDAPTWCKKVNHDKVVSIGVIVVMILTIWPVLVGLLIGRQIR